MSSPRQGLDDVSDGLRAELELPESAGFSVELLGAPRVTRLPATGDPVEVPLRLRRAWRGLALLALAPGRRVGREELVRTLWPEADPSRVRRNLPPTVYVLRRALGAPGGHRAIDAAGKVYALSPRLRWRIDALDFEQAIETGRSAARNGDPAAAERAWVLALSLCRGPFLAGDEDAWVEEQRERFHRRRQELLRLLGDLRVGEGDLERALDTYRLSLAEEPLQEDLHLALLRIYARQGRRDLVRRHFDRFSRLLADELGVEPGLEITLEYHRLMAAAER